MSPTISGLDLRRVTWILVGAVLAGAIAFALYRYLGTLVFALFVYYASRPVQGRFEARTSHADLATTATMLTFVLPIVVVLIYTGFVVVQEAAAFVRAASVPGVEAVLAPYVSVAEFGSPATLVEQLREEPNAVIDEPTRSAIAEFVGPVGTVLAFAFEVLTRLFLLFVFVFYLLRDDAKIGAWFRRSVGHDATVVEFVEGVDRDLERVFYGNLMTIVATGAIAVATYLAFGFLAPVETAVYRPVLIGVLVAIGTLVPVVGMLSVYLPVTALLAIQALAGDVPPWYPVAFLAISFLIVDVVPDYFVRAYLSAGSLNMGLILLSYVLGTMAFGWAGLFLGPIVVVGFVHFARGVFPDLASGRRVQ